MLVKQGGIGLRDRRSPSLLKNVGSLDILVYPRFRYDSAHPPVCEFQIILSPKEIFLSTLSLLELSGRFDDKEPSKLSADKNFYLKNFFIKLSQYFNITY